jgi:phage tail-like protein
LSGGGFDRSASCYDGLFEATAFDGIASRMDHYPALFAPATAPDRMLPYLARWLDLFVPERLLSDPPRLRELLLHGDELARLRGTIDGLRLAARLYLDLQLQVREPAVDRARFLLASGTTLGDTTGPVLGGETVLAADPGPTWLGDAPLGQCFLKEEEDRTGCLPHRFEVLVPAYSMCRSDDLALLKALVDLDKPAHTTYCIRLEAPAGWVLGAASVLGQALGAAYDRHLQDPSTYGLALLNGPPRPKPLEEGFLLGHDSRLPGESGPPRFRLEATLGRTTRIGA